MKYIVAIIFFTTTIYSSAQEKNKELVTDRPDQTESAAIVPLHFLQIESGFLLETNKENGLSKKSFAYNSTLLRYGLLTNLELRLGLEYLGNKTEFSGFNVNYSGLSPLYTGLKIKIIEEKGVVPEVAFLGALIFPFTAGEEYKPSYTAADMRLAFAHTLTDRLSLGYNLGAEWDGETAIPSWFYSASLGIGLTDKLGAFLESYGSLPEKGKAEHMADAGITYLILPNLQFDISGGIGIQNGPDNFIGFGLSYRLPQ